MSLATESTPVPLDRDADGVMRVGGTRVTLDTVLAAFNEGASAEDIVSQYPSLELADVYAVVAYYLRNRDQVNAYLHERASHRKQVKAETERRFEPAGIRDRLLSRTSA